MDNVIIFCAHSDDSEISIGGTILKYSKKYNLIKVIFSSGEKSSPHLRKDYIIKERIKETERIGKEEDIKKNIYFDLEDSKLQNFIDDEKVINKTEKLIKKYNPVKIFTLTSIDPHPDHKAVNNIIMKVVRNLKYKGEVYGYEVWNLLNLSEPVVYEDISKFMKKKIRLMRGFKSQWFYIYTLILPTYFRAILNGRKIKVKYAERFFRLK